MEMKANVFQRLVIQTKNKKQKKREEKELEDGNFLENVHLLERYKNFKVLFSIVYLFLSMFGWLEIFSTKEMQKRWKLITLRNAITN